MVKKTRRRRRKRRRKTRKRRKRGGYSQVCDPLHPCPEGQICSSKRQDWFTGGWGFSWMPKILTGYCTPATKRREDIYRGKDCTIM